MEHEGEIHVDPYGESTLTGPEGLRLRRWREEDLPSVLRAYEDPAMRRWLAVQVFGPEEAADWLETQRTGWAAGTRFAFAVTESEAEDELLGNVVLKRSDPPNGPAEVGYWTTASARGRGVATGAGGAHRLGVHDLRRTGPYSAGVAAPGGQRGLVPEWRRSADTRWRG